VPGRVQKATIGPSHRCRKGGEKAKESGRGGNFLRALFLAKGRSGKRKNLSVGRGKGRVRSVVNRCSKKNSRIEKRKLGIKNEQEKLSDTLKTPPGGGGDREGERAGRQEQHSRVQIGEHQGKSGEPWSCASCFCAMLIKE